MALAAGAEQASRELSREAAKEEFGRRNVILQGNGMPGLDCSEKEEGTERSTLVKDGGESARLPKDWFVRSYLAGYDSLYSAFQLDADVCSSFTDVLEAFERGDEMKQDNGQIPLQQADRQEKDVLPPVHLRDLDTVECRALDVEAYRLLCLLTHLFELIFHKGSHFSAAKAESTVNQLLMEEDSFPVIVDCPPSFSTGLLDDIFGMAEWHKIQKGAGEVSQYFPFKEDEGSESPVQEGDELREIFTLLRSPRCVEITGVHWDSKGHISSVIVQDPYYNIDESEEAFLDEVPEFDHYTPSVSPQLLARLMSLCSSFAYICGDTNSALKCLRYSCYLDARLTDSFVKLGSLLVDTDEVETAAEIFDAALDRDPLNPFIYMHKAELMINLNDFAAALTLLKRAHGLLRNSKSEVPRPPSAFFGYSFTAEEDNEKLEKNTEGRPLQDSRILFRQSELVSNVNALLAVVHFRADPANPEVCFFSRC